MHIVIYVHSSGTDALDLFWWIILSDADVVDVLCEAWSVVVDVVYDYCNALRRLLRWNSEIRADDLQMILGSDLAIYFRLRQQSVLAVANGNQFE